MNFPKALKYSKEHEWVKVEGNIATIGITDFAQSQLGDVVFVDVDTLDEGIEKDTEFGSIEAVKTVSDLFMPISGKVIEVNGALENNPELVNNDPYEGGWLIKIEVLDLSHLENLMSAEQYANMVKG